MQQPSDQLLVIFGASGDLTGRKLLPALFDLWQRKLLPAHFAVLGTSRTPYTDGQFRKEQLKHLKEHYGDKLPDEVHLKPFLELLYYQPIDTALSTDYAKLKKRIETLQKDLQIPDRVLFYLATPPVLYPVIPQDLAENKMHRSRDKEGWRRIIIEKPFGSDLESAVELNKQLTGIFKEKDIFRIDHYLGKETVQNILVLRFANGIFESLWNRQYIQAVELYAYEELGVENRGGYYDTAGAMRDMIQNHLMQLLAFTTMEPPAVFEPETLRDEIVKLIRSIRPVSLTDMDRQVVRGQYEGFREEKGIQPYSTTETWVGLKLYIDNLRWSGRPIYLYTGKKMKEKRSEIIIHFKSTPHPLFAAKCSGGSCNKLVIRIQPDEGITLKFALKVPGEGFQIQQVGMDFKYSSLKDEPLPDAYVRLLVDAMAGDSTLYTRSDALEASWSLVDPILQYWQKEKENDLFFYTPGTNGPEEQWRLKSNDLFL